MKTVEQLSIFLENKVGKLQYIMEVLAKADTRIVAAMVADTSEYGILRLITPEPRLVYDILKKNNITANISQVIAFAGNSSANSFFDQLKFFSKEGIGIEYMYSFANGDRSFVIVRVNDIAGAMEVVEKYGIEIFTNSELSQF